MAQQQAIYTPSEQGGRLYQGEILSNVTQIHLDPGSITSSGSVAVNFSVHPYAIIVTQDCDLEWDFRARCGEAKENKEIPNVLFCEINTASSLRGRADIKSDMWKRIVANKDERYQYLRSVTCVEDARSEGLPDLAIDFKRYFTIPTDELYRRLSSEIKRRCRLLSPYLEHLSTRFYYFQIRVALPREHFGD